MLRQIIASDITCGYHKGAVLNNISLEIQEGDFLGIIGPNGSGKSTLLRALSRCLKPLKGVIFYKGINLYELTHKQVSQEFAFVAQDTIFSFVFSVWEIVLMGRIPYLRRMQQETSNDLEVVRESLKITDTLGLRDRQINELSAGEKQMVIIAKALTQQPRVLFLDEPTSHLDIGHQVKILNLLKGLNQNKKLTTIVVLHDLNLASEYCSKILLLNKGLVFKIGTPQEVLTYPNIEEVYNTLVVVNKNPVSGKPHVLLACKEKACKEKA